MTHEQLNEILAKQFGYNQAFIDRLNGHIDRRMIARMKDSLKNVQSQLANMYAEHGGDVTLAEMAKYDRLAKMENEIRAPFDGLVSNLSVQQGQTVAQNDLLATLSPT